MNQNTELLEKSGALTAGVRKAKPPARGIANRAAGNSGADIICLMNVQTVWNGGEGYHD